MIETVSRAGRQPKRQDDNRTAIMPPGRKPYGDGRQLRLSGVVRQHLFLDQG